MKSLYQGMLQERADRKAELAALLDKEGRTAEEETRSEELLSEIEALNPKIEAEERKREAARAEPAPTVLKFKRGDTEAGAMANYLRTGDASGLQFQAAYNNTDMNIATPADGGYAVPTGLLNQIIARRDESLLAPRLGVRNIPGKGLTVRVPIDGEADTLFNSEAEAAAIDQDAPALSYKDFTLVKYAKYITLSWELLRDEDANLMGFLNDWIGRGIAATHNNALITEALANGTAGLTLDAAAAIGAGEVPELVGKLAPEYQEGAQWILNPETTAYLQGLTGNAFYFAPMSAGYAGRPTMWGYPVNQSSYIAKYAASAKSLLFGNFNFMGVRNDPTITMLRDPYSAAANGQVRLWFWFATVYAVLQAEAIQYATHPSA